MLQQTLFKNSYKYGSQDENSKPLWAPFHGRSGQMTRKDFSDLSVSEPLENFHSFVFNR